MSDRYQPIPRALFNDPEASASPFQLAIAGYAGAPSEPEQVNSPAFKSLIRIVARGVFTYPGLLEQKQKINGTTNNYHHASSFFASQNPFFNASQSQASGIQKFKCPVCQDAFENEILLAMHYRIACPDLRLHVGDFVLMDASMGELSKLIDNLCREREYTATQQNEQHQSVETFFQRRFNEMSHNLGLANATRAAERSMITPTLIENRVREAAANLQLASQASQCPKDYKAKAVRTPGNARQKARRELPKINIPSLAMMNQLYTRETEARSYGFQELGTAMSSAWAMPPVEKKQKRQ